MMCLKKTKTIKINEFITVALQRGVGCDTVLCQLA